MESEKAENRSRLNIEESDRLEDPTEEEHVQWRVEHTLDRSRYGRHVRPEEQ